MVHGLAGVPPTNDAIRFVSIVSWLATASLSSFWTFLVSRNVLVSLLAYVMVFEHLRVLPFEPGHPHDVGGFLGVLSLLIVTTTD